MKNFAFLKLSMIAREKTFAFSWFAKGINFRDLGPKTQKFLPLVGQTFPWEFELTSVDCVCIH